MSGSAVGSGSNLNLDGARHSGSRYQNPKDTPRIPVGILTTSQAEEDIVRSYELHANCYIRKPVDLDQFLKVIRSIEDFWLTVVKLPRDRS